VLSLAMSAVLIGLLVAYGGSSPTAPPTPAPPPPPPPPSVVSTGQGAMDANFVGRAAPFATSLTGTLEVTVDWAFATNDIDVFLARGDCTPQQFVATQCNIGALSTSASAKPESVQLTGAAPGTYTLLLGNVGPDRESLSWQVVLTPSASSGSASSLGAAERTRDLPEKARRYRSAGPTW
jgi:hypothetical protein